MRKYKKSNDELREEGLLLIRNGLKAYEIGEPLLTDYNTKEEKTKADSANKNWGCYMTQQSIELLIKGLIKYYGWNFRDGHFISGNAKILSELSERNSILRQLDDTLYTLQSKFSYVLYKWATIGRYVDLYVYAKNIETALNLNKDLYDFIHRNHLLDE